MSLMLSRCVTTVINLFEKANIFVTSDSLTQTMHLCRRRHCSHTGQCKSTEGYLQPLGVGFYPPAIPSVIIMFKHDTNLFVIKHGTRTIDKIAVYDIASIAMIYLMVHSLNHG